METLLLNAISKQYHHFKTVTVSSDQGTKFIGQNYRPHPKDGEGNVFSLFTPRGEGVPRITQDGGGSTPARLGWGYPSLVRMGGYPGQIRMGVPQPGMGYPSPIQGWGAPPPSRDGVPPWDRTAGVVLDTQQAVCLLRSRRRTVSF